MLAADAVAVAVMRTVQLLDIVIRAAVPGTSLVSLGDFDCQSARSKRTRDHDQGDACSGETAAAAPHHVR